MALTTSIMTGGSNSHETTSEEANGIATDFVSEGIIGSYSNTSGVAPATGAFAVNAQGTPDMTVAVSSGVAYVTGTPTSQNSQTFRVYNSASENVTISANSSGSTKYDWVYIKLDATLLANPTLAGTTTATLVTSRSTSAGTDDGTPPTYGYPIAVVTVANGAASITNATIRDIRATASIGTAAGIATGWNETGLPAVSSVTNNGNRSYSVVFGSTVASLLSPGMRLRTTRTVTAPTQCADLEASSSQYFSRASGSVTGMTFTDDFVVSAWVKLESYTDVVIASRFNGSSGWTFYITSAGRVEMVGNNAGAGNVSVVTSYQSLPLNKWVHVAAQLDMSAFTATTTTSYVMIDGVDVPAVVSRLGTNPTALVQAGNLEIGGRNGGLLPFDGKIAQVAIYSAKVTQANIRATISQGLSGSETSLISAYSFNSSINDLNANANNLTAQGGALATATDSPFGQDSNGVTAGTTDYALVMKVNGATVTAQVPEGCTIPTSGGVSATAYSTTGQPFGFTIDKERWAGRYLLKSNNDKTSGITIAVYYNINGNNFTLPVGAWDISGTVSGVVTHAGATFLATSIGISSSSSAANDERLFVSTNFTNNSATEVDLRYAGFKAPLSVTSATPMYVLNWTNQSTTTLLRTSYMDVTFIPAGI